MAQNKNLKSRIIKSVFLYETKRFTVENMLRLFIFLLSGGAILVFGGVIMDIVTESEMGDLLEGFMKTKIFTYAKIGELISVIQGELPEWLMIGYAIGIMGGCILIVSIARNWNLIIHKVRSIVSYWTHL